jgi:hypothetical protein
MQAWIVHAETSMVGNSHNQGDVVETIDIWEGFKVHGMIWEDRRPRSSAETQRDT